MNVTCLNQEIESIQAHAAPLTAERTDHHQQLFAVFKKIENALAQNTNSDAPEETKRIEGLIEAQTVVIRTAATLPARTAKDLMYKLALWRWDAPDLDKPVQDMHRADAIAYSAFRDLADMLSDNSTLKDIDHSN
ncbi:hypothetical protein [Hyphococcus lacteus]|uniref:Uncharacterized protein n=1 Tax=Hyphococcus lacteus TaxID=3143536 RepID=A0ABV3Z3F9_9PROT